jgi:hypothetical protein
VAGDVDGDEPVQEGLGSTVVAEERIAVDAIQLTSRGGRSTSSRRVGRSLQAQQRVQPRLHVVSGAVSDRFLQFYLG